MRIMTVSEFYRLGFHVEPSDKPNFVKLYYGDTFIANFLAETKFRDITEISTALLSEWRKSNPEWNKVCKQKFDKVHWYQRIFGLRDGNFSETIREIGKEVK